jgi:hypothetical protein
MTGEIESSWSLLLLMMIKQLHEAWCGFPSQVKRNVIGERNCMTKYDNRKVISRAVLPNRTFLDDRNIFVCAVQYGSYMWLYNI